MLLSFSEKDIQIHFYVTDEGKLLLSSFGNTVNARDGEGVPDDGYSAAAIHLAGHNPDDHHGGKHTGTSGERTLRYAAHRSYKNEYGKKLEIELRDNRMKAILHYQFFHDVSSVKVWTEVVNSSEDILGLEYLASFALGGLCEGEAELYIPHNAWVRELDWKKYRLSELGLEGVGPSSTKRISISNTGSWSSKEYLPMGAISHAETELTLLWQIEHNGSWQWELGDLNGRRYLRLSGPNEAENHWYKELTPGERFVSVPAAISVGKTFDGALAEMTEYRRRITRKNRCDALLPVIFNDYMNCLWAEPTTEKELPVIDCAKELGAEYYCMDAGWYADGTWWETVGEWEPCEWRFPNGIREVFQYIRKKGMIPGIWLEIEVMGIHCPSAGRLPDDWFFMRHGKRVIDHGRYQLDFRNGAVRDYATSIIDRVVGEYGVGYIKMDYNIDAGIGTERAADSFGDGLLEHNRAYLAWLEGIMDKYPDLVIENCSSGGMRMDYAMLARHSIQSVSDQESVVYTVPIAAAAATAVLPEQAAIWSYPKAGESLRLTAMNMVNSMLLRMHLSGEVTRLSEEQREIVKEGVRVYKELRQEIPRMAPFYPMGLPRYGGGWQCAGYESEKKAYLAVWRMDSGQEEIILPVKATGANIIYGIRDAGGCRASADGISVWLKEPYSAVVIEVQKG